MEILPPKARVSIFQFLLITEGVFSQVAQIPMDLLGVALIIQELSRFLIEFP